MGQNFVLSILLAAVDSMPRFSQFLDILSRGVLFSVLTVVTFGVYIFCALVHVFICFF